MYCVSVKVKYTEKTNGLKGKLFLVINRKCSLRSSLIRPSIDEEGTQTP